MAMRNASRWLTGRTFGRWNVISFDRRRGCNRFWLCQCSCGISRPVNEQSLITGDSRSCKKCCNVTTRPYRRTPEYRVWLHMRERCTNKRAAGYKNYGGRGISVSPKWDDFLEFLADMGPKPSAHLQIDRINNEGNYEPGNCRWATRRQNSRNRRGNRHLTAFGRTQVLQAWADEYGHPPSRLIERIDYYGWDVERALTETPRAGRRSHLGK